MKNNMKITIPDAEREVFNKLAEAVDYGSEYVNSTDICYTGLGLYGTTTVTVWEKGKYSEVLSLVSEVLTKE